MNQINKNIVKKFFDIVRQSKTIFITGHIRPDGDTIGSSLALWQMLKKLGKKNVDIIMKNSFLNNYNFLPNVDKILFLDKIDKLENTYDLGIILECSDTSRIGFDLNFYNFKNVINIDHHQNHHSKNNNPKRRNWLNIIYPQFASCAEIIYDILEYGKIKIDKNIALCLYVGIVTDTGKFQWSNTNIHVFITAAKLLKYGINPFYVYKKVYGSKSLESLHLLSKVLQTLDVIRVGKYNIGYIVATNEMFKNTNTKVTDTEEFINFVLSVKDVDIAIFFREEDGGKTRVSFRSDIIDVSKLANNFGGGGHRCASAATVLGDIESVKEKVFDGIRKIQ